MRDINYDRRNEWYSNNEYDLQRLVGKKLLSIDYKISDSNNRRYKDVEAHDVSLRWEGFVMSFVVTSEKAIPIFLHKYINCKLEDWDAMPNHACDMMLLYFEGDDNEINFNTFGGIKWENI